MEPTPDSGLPPGVNNPAPPAPAPAAAVAAPAPLPAPAPAIPPVEKWDWLQIGVFALIGVVGCYTIYYFRYKTRQMPDEIADLSSKNSALERRVNQMHDQMYGQAA